mgnify:CR=1 FL=1
MFVPFANDEVATAPMTFVPLPYKTAPEVSEVAPVPPLDTASVPEMVESVDVAPLYTWPLASTARAPPVRLVNHWVVAVRSVVEALLNRAVEDAAREKGAPVSCRSVEVALVVCPR